MTDRTSPPDSQARPPLTVTVDELARLIHGPAERDWFSCLYADTDTFEDCPSRELHRDFAYSIFDKAVAR